jgi:hypothetical protein
MHRAALPLLVVAFASSIYAQQPAPTSAPAAMLSKGEIAYTAPDGWKSLGESTDDRRAGWQLGNDEALIVVQVAPQTQTISESLGPKLKAQVLQTLKAEAAKGNITPIVEPTVETDPPFLLKIHDVFRAKEKYSDRMQFYRGVGRNIVTVVANSFSEDPQKAAAVHAIGEQVARSVRLNRPGASAMLDQVINAPQAPVTAGPATQPVLFRQARLRITPPSGWDAEPTDKPSGIIVVWRDPADSTNIITLSYRLLPASARNADASLRTMAINELARGEKPDFQAAGAKAIGATTNVNDKRFLRKTKTDYDVKGSRITVGFRQVRAGDGVVSITSISLQDKSAAVDEIADKVATDVRSTGM